MKHVETRVSDQNSVHIVPFADRAVMDVFMEGSDRSTKEFFFVLIQNALQQVAERVIKDNFTLTDEEYKVVKAMNDKTISEIVKRSAEVTRDWIKQHNVDRVLDVVKALPKEDMATLAEALVEVTALKKKVSSDLETVGVPLMFAWSLRGMA